MQIAGNLLLSSGFRANGEVRLLGAKVQGSVSCRDRTFVNPGSRAFSADLVQITGTLFVDTWTVDGSLNLYSARCAQLVDDPSRWSKSIGLTGFDYERFATSNPANETRIWDFKRRASWLDKQKSHDPDPYHHLAAVYRSHGYRRRAERALILGRRRARRRIHGAARPFDALYDWTIGYGYRPARVLMMLVVAAGLSLFMSGSDSQQSLRSNQNGTVYAPVELDSNSRAPGVVVDRCAGGSISCFNPILYSIDTIVPLLDLGQRTEWHAMPDEPAVAAVTSVLGILGWIGTSVAIVAFAKVTRNDG